VRPPTGHVDEQDITAEPRVTARAHPNLALVKYWGRADDVLNLPSNGSISINLGGLTTTTSVELDAALDADVVEIDGRAATGRPQERVVEHLDRVRALAGIETRARVSSASDFPVSAGLASSASAFAALSLAATSAAGLELDAPALSALARRGSGSACRSIPDGFAEWLPGSDDQSSHAVQLAAPEHWDLAVVSVVLDESAKQVSSLDGHAAAPTSELFAARLEALPATLETVRRAIQERDLETLLMATERDAVSMHAIAMTSRPANLPWLSGVYYWKPATLTLIHQVQTWRRDGLPVGFTIDAGANVHLICDRRDLAQLQDELTRTLQDVARILVSSPGRGAWVVDAP